jgi:hypothetical protein
MPDAMEIVREAPSGDLAEKLEKVKQRVDHDADVMSDQRNKANEDLRFVNVTGGMWENFLEPEFERRAKMEFDLVSNHLFRFIGEWNLNRMGVEYRPDDDVTQDADAELLNGIYRADFRDGSGKISMDNAVYEAATCGYGAFKMATVFEDEGDPENERQRIEWRPIPNAFNTVFWDSSAIRPDKRDARWCTVLTEYTDERFEEVFPGFIPSSAYTPETLRSMNFTGQNTVTSPIYVATSYEVVRKKELVFRYDNLVSGEPEIYSKDEHKIFEDELKADPHRKFVRERKVVVQHVEKRVFSGTHFLKPVKIITGKWIPIIPVYGYRAYVDGVEWYKGLVRPLKDASRLFNMHMNQLAENSASNGQKIPIFDPDQMPDNIAEGWADLTNAPFVLAESLKDENGQIVHQGPLGFLDPGKLDPNTAASIQALMGFIQETTGGIPKDTMDPNASGKAIRAMMKRENMNTQPLQDNINGSIEWSGTVYQSMAAETYNQEQMVRTIGQDGTEGREQLLKVVMDEETGKFIRANNLRGKRFRAYSDVGPQYESLREETVETLKAVGDFLKDTPAGAQYIPAIIFTMLDNMEGVGVGPLKEMNRKNMILQGIKKPETDEEKQMLAEAQQPKADPQAQLMESLATQANAEAQKFQSESRNLDSKSIVNVADARKKSAETAQIVSETEEGRAKTLQELRKEAFEQARALPFGGGNQPAPPAAPSSP